MPLAGFIKITIFKIDLQISDKVHDSGLDCSYLLIDISSLEVLRQRNIGRITETEGVTNKIKFNPLQKDSKTQNFLFDSDRKIKIRKKVKYKLKKLYQ